MAGRLDCIDCNTHGTQWSLGCYIFPSETLHMAIIEEVFQKSNIFLFLGLLFPGHPVSGSHSQAMVMLQRYNKGLLFMGH